MAVALRILGQATKQTPQVLNALTPRASACNGATPRTPLRAVTAIGDKSPFFAGEASPFLFDNAASSSGTGLQISVNDQSEKHSRLEPLVQMLPTQMGFQKPHPSGVPSGTLLQRLSAHATDVHVDLSEDTVVAETADSGPESARQAALSRKSRAAQRTAFRESFETCATSNIVLLGRKTFSQQSRPREVSGTTEDQSEEQIAQAARQAFLSRQAARSGRLMATRI